MTATCDIQCHCGRLLARQLEKTLELKCVRCKRKLIVAIGGADKDDDVWRVCQVDEGQ